MPAVNVNIQPEIISWALSQTQEEKLGDKLMNHITQWLNGTKTPTFNQIEDFSKKANIPLGYFFLQTPPVEQIELLEYRTVDSIQLANPSRNLIDTIHEMESIQDWMKDYRQELGFDVLPVVGCMKGVKDASVIVDRIRKDLDLEDTWYEKCKDPREAFSYIRGKPGAMADIIFQNFWKDRAGVLRIANEMLDKHFRDERDDSFLDEIEETKQKIKVQERKFDVLVEMRMSGEIDKAMFEEKKKALNSEIERLNKVLASYQLEEDLSEDDCEKKLEVLKYGLEQDFNFSTHSIPEEVIDAFVDEIIAYKDCFVWKLNLYDDDVKLKVDGRKGHSTVSLVESPHISDSSTGCYC